MRTNSSRHTCSFGDHPWPIKTIFPTVKDMHKYISAYADKHLDPLSISLKHTVVGVERSNSHWKVTWKTEQDALEQDDFDFLIVSSGFFRKKYIPEIGGLQSFPGTVMHSSDYHGLDQVRDKRIAIVGDSFSAIELAGEIAPLAKKVTHIHPRPFYVFPRFMPLRSGDPSSPFVPIDLALYWKSKRKSPHEGVFPTQEELHSKHMFFRTVCGDQGMLAPSLSVAPDRMPFVAISEHYLNSVRDGSIDLVEGRLQSVKHSTFTMSSGEVIDEAYDVLIMATGFRSDLPYFSPETQTKIEYRPQDSHHPFLAHRLTFHPDLPNAAFVGMYRGPFMGVVMLQSQWVAEVFSGKRPGPSPDELAHGLSMEKMLRDTIPRPQFPHSDYVGLLNDLAETLDITPSSLWPGRNTDIVIPSWKITRRLESANLKLPSGNFEGKADFTRRLASDPDAEGSKTEYAYLEQGKLSTDGGMSFDAQRRYRYNYSEEDDRIDAYFDDSADKGFFHSQRFLAPGEEAREGGMWAPWVGEAREGWCAMGEHLCAPDTYVAAYWFHFSGIHLSEWRVTYKVKGPNKDYVSYTTFTRP